MFSRRIFNCTKLARRNCNRVTNCANGRNKFARTCVPSSPSFVVRLFGKDWLISRRKNPFHRMQIMVYSCPVDHCRSPDENKKLSAERCGLLQRPIESSSNYARFCLQLVTDHETLIRFFSCLFFFFFSLSVSTRRNTRGCLSGNCQRIIFIRALIVYSYRETLDARNYGGDCWSHWWFWSCLDFVAISFACFAILKLECNRSERFWNTRWTCFDFVETLSKFYFYFRMLTYWKTFVLENFEALSKFYLKLKNTNIPEDVTITNMNENLEINR